MMSAKRWDKDRSISASRGYRKKSEFTSSNFEFLKDFDKLTFKSKYGVNHSTKKNSNIGLNREKVIFIGNSTFTYDSCRFQDVKLIGQGSFGIVCSSFDVESNKKIAIKKIHPISKSIDDCKHILREVKIMRHLGIHENIITLYDLVLREKQDELYIIMELLDSDLHRIIQSKQTLTISHCRYLMFQLFCGVKYLHDHRIIHRDLKPGNLLVTKDCKLRITDFGLARERPLALSTDLEMNEVVGEAMTEHVVTRWYRAPELMLLPDGFYDYSVDMWSCGTILGELLGRTAMFPGKNFIDQLSLIFDVIGCPKAIDIEHIQNSQARKFLESQTWKKKKSLSQLYPTCLEQAPIELLDSLLQFNPLNRLSANDVFHSEFFSPLRKLNLPCALFPRIESNEFAFHFERSQLSRQQLKYLIIAEVNSLNEEAEILQKSKSFNDVNIYTMNETNINAMNNSDFQITYTDNLSKTEVPYGTPKKISTANDNINKLSPKRSLQFPQFSPTKVTISNNQIKEQQKSPLKELQASPAVSRVNEILSNKLFSESYLSPEKNSNSDYEVANKRIQTSPYNSPTKSEPLQISVNSKNNMNRTCEPVIQSNQDPAVEDDEALINEILIKLRSNGFSKPIFGYPDFKDSVSDHIKDNESAPKQANEVVSNALASDNITIMNVEPEKKSLHLPNQNNLFKGKKVTIPKSPKFSKMSWERRRESNNITVDKPKQHASAMRR